MDDIYYYEQCSDFKKLHDFSSLTETDYENISNNFIEFIDRLIIKNKKLLIYFSLGGAPPQKNDIKSFDNQLLPDLNFKDDYEPIYIGIDNFNNKLTVQELEKYNNLEHINLFNMYWFDNYSKLVESLYRLIDHNIKTGGFLICTNYCKYKVFRSPLFSNLISTFYNNYSEEQFKNVYLKIKYGGYLFERHKDSIINNRCLFLEWDGFISDRLYLSGFDNNFNPRNISVINPYLVTKLSDLNKINIINSNEIYFDVKKLVIDI